MLTHTRVMAPRSFSDAGYPSKTWSFSNSIRPASTSWASSSRKTYAATVKDLGSRDVVSRAIYTGIREGRGVNGKNYVYLDVRPEAVNKYAAMDGRTNPDGSPYNMTGEQLLKK